MEKRVPNPREPVSSEPALEPSSWATGPSTKACGRQAARPRRGREGDLGGVPGGRGLHRMHLLFPSSPKM